MNAIDYSPHTTCGHLSCDNRHSEILIPVPVDHVSYDDQEISGPPDFNDLQHSSSVARCANVEDFPTPERRNVHPRLLPSGQLKFTQKWPAPSTLKHLAVSAGYKFDGPPVISILERGLGSALPRSGRWTPSKICLLLSIATVFIYGTMLLLWASVTWFDGEHTPYLQYCSK